MPTFYQVGGSVRDELLGRPSKDIDWAVEAPSFAAMREAILQRGGEIFLETPKFLTIRAKVPELGACDFVLCRKDGEYKDGRRPETVEPGTILDDLARRDFTINAIAKDEKGNILDPHNGQQDLKRRLIRCVGAPADRFQEDGLRLVRAFRFAVTLDFRLDPSIGDVFDDSEQLENLLRGVSHERVRAELLRCFAHDTYHTLCLFEDYPELRGILFYKQALWLRPTLEER